MTTEAQEQISLIAQASYHPVTSNYLFAIPNGGSRHPVEAKNLRLQGVKAGVADLFLAYPVPPYSGLFIELKRTFPTKGRLSAEQALFLDRLASVGYATTVSYGANEAWAVMMSYLDGKYEQRSYV